MFMTLSSFKVNDFVSACLVQCPRPCLASRLIILCLFALSNVHDLVQLQGELFCVRLSRPMSMTLSSFKVNGFVFACLANVSTTLSSFKVNCYV